MQVGANFAFAAICTLKESTFPLVIDNELEEN